MHKQIVVTLNDYSKLVGLIEMASLQANMPDVVSLFYQKLLDAEMVSQEDIDRTVITMNSRVHIRDLKANRETEVAITYPGDAAPAERKVSVFSEIGSVLFGRMEKEVVSWNTPQGPGMFEIVKVTYQPEAAGDYYL